MPRACHEEKATVGRVVHAPDAVSRQALRMLWHFRCNRESAEVTPAHE